MLMDPWGFQTTQSYLVLVTVDYLPHAFAYEPPEVSPGAQRNFLSGPGEGQPLQSLSLAFEGVIRAEGKVLRYIFVCLPIMGIYLPFPVVSYLVNITSCSLLALRQLCNAYHGLLMMTVMGMATPQRSHP